MAALCCVDPGGSSATSQRYAAQHTKAQACIANKTTTERILIHCSVPSIVAQRVIQVGLTHSKLHGSRLQLAFSDLKMKAVEQQDSK